MINKKFILAGMLLVLFISFTSAVYNITGYVEDAKDGTSSNEREVVLWNPLNGMEDNLTDVVGSGGNSGTSNSYLFDCELLSNSCQAGDNLSIRIIDVGNSYVSEEVSVEVSGSGSDTAENLSLNSPPNSSAIFPSESDAFSSVEISFNCSANDLDSNLESLSLYGNWSSGWHENGTKSISGSEDSVVFTKNLSEGNFKYACAVEDNSTSIKVYSENKSFFVDETAPEIMLLESNISYSCGTSNTTRIECTTLDLESGVENVTLEVESPSETKNYSMEVLSGDTYYADVLLNETGTWNYNCVSVDSAGNENRMNSSLEVYSENPELYVDSDKMSFSDENPVESENISVFFDLENLGCSEANNVNVSFYEGDPEVSGKFIDDLIVSISDLSSMSLNFSWISKIGFNSLFVFADPQNLIGEINELNNKANKNISVGSWQSVYGNVTLDKVIGTESGDIGLWINESNLEGGVFVADTEAEIDWLSLQAIGKDSSGFNSSSDFSEIDSLLNMSGFEDSVSERFSDNQVPKNTEEFLLHKRNISNVPVIDSGENSSFITGILWDMSDDSNGEFDVSEKEDIVFVTKVNKQSQGEYGIYDYELKVPAKIREYYTEDREEFYLYYDLN